MSPPTAPTRAVRLAGALALAGALGGCTLVSGWSDLQGGTRPSGDAGSSGGQTADASGDSGQGAIDSGSPGQPPADSGGSGPGADAQSVDSAPPVDTTIACGTSRCKSDEGCCEGLLGGTATCQSSSTSCNVPNILVGCSSSAACTADLGHSAQCCSSIGGGSLPSVACQTSCASGDQVVCDPTAVDPGCSAGTTCKPSPDGFAFHTCQ